MREVTKNGPLEPGEKRVFVSISASGHMYVAMSKEELGRFNKDADPNDMAEVLVEALGDSVLNSLDFEVEDVVES